VPQSLPGSGSEEKVLCTCVQSNQLVQSAVTFELLWMMMMMNTATTMSVVVVVVVSQNLTVL